MKSQREAPVWSGSPASDGDRGGGLYFGATREVGTAELLRGHAPRHPADTRTATTSTLVGRLLPPPTYLATLAIRIERP